MDQEHALGLEAIRDIRTMMARSSRFISLSGWSGIWAGAVALAAAGLAYPLVERIANVLAYRDARPAAMPWEMSTLVIYALATIVVAGLGAAYFTMRKARRQQLPIWGAASKKLFVSVAIPMIAGGIFCIALLQQDQWQYLVPCCLSFYGMGLVSGGKYTLGEIRYLGYAELLLGCICLFFPAYSLLFWALGFGVLHIVYGIIMWNRYDKQSGI